MPPVKFNIGAIVQIVIGKIIQNTSRGIDSEGKPFKPYSTRPFSMPFGAFTDFMTKSATSRFNKQNKDNYQIFTKSGKTWILIKGGYLALKTARFKTGESTVNLQVLGTGRGGMLGSIQSKEISDTTALILFGNKRASKLAYYHNISGAGKSKVIRKFLGLPKSDIEDIKKVAIKELIINIDNKIIKIG